MPYVPEYLEPWVLQPNYSGETFEGCYVVYSQHRGSDALTRSNYRRILEDFGECDGVFDRRFGHWAVGWVETVFVDPSEASDETLRALDEVQAALDSYPVYDEEDFSALEWDEVHEFWGDISVAERIGYCRDAGVSIFAARRDGEIPHEVFDRLRD